MTPEGTPQCKSGGLKRSMRPRRLSPWSGLHAPTVLSRHIGIVTKQTHGVGPLAYIVALRMMIFTAISYAGWRSSSLPAGSCYLRPARLSHNEGASSVGWAALLRLMLTPARQRGDSPPVRVSCSVSAGMELGRAVSAFITGLKEWSLTDRRK